MTQNTNGHGHGHVNGNGSGHGVESPLYTVPPGHLLLHLSSNKTAAFSLPSFPSVSFYLYIPSSHPVSRRKRGEISPTPSTTNGDSNNGHPNGLGHSNGANGDGNGNQERRYPLVVCMHGSSRDAEGVRNRWADLAEREGFVVLAPLFPVDMNVGRPTDLAYLWKWQRSDMVLDDRRDAQFQGDTIPTSWP